MEDPIGATYYKPGSTTADNLQQADIASLGASSGALPRAPMTQSARQYRDPANNRLWKITIPPEPLLTLTSVASPPSFSKDTMTFSVCSSNQSGFSAISSGYMLYHYATGTVFVVTSVGAPVANSACSSPATSVQIATLQQNNITVAPGTNKFETNTLSDRTLAGYSIVIPTGALLPRNLYYGAFTAGSRDITNIQYGTNRADDLTAYYQPGDVLYNFDARSQGYASVYGSAAAWPIPGPTTRIESVTNGAPGSMTMSAPAASTGVFPLFPYELRP